MLFPSSLSTKVKFETEQPFFLQHFFPINTIDISAQVGNLHNCRVGNRVLSYSVLRVAIIKAEEEHAKNISKDTSKEIVDLTEESELIDLTQEEKPEESTNEEEASSTNDECQFYFSSGFRCGLTEIKVVDRRLKPRYLLMTCPVLKSLYIDWQVRY